MHLNKCITLISFLSFSIFLLWSGIIFFLSSWYTYRITNLITRHLLLKMRFYMRVVWFISINWNANDVIMNWKVIVEGYIVKIVIHSLNRFWGELDVLYVPIEKNINNNKYKALTCTNRCFCSLCLSSLEPCSLYFESYSHEKDNGKVSHIFAFPRHLHLTFEGYKIGCAKLEGWGGDNASSKMTGTSNTVS